MTEGTPIVQTFRVFLLFVTWLFRESEGGIVPPDFSLFPPVLLRSRLLLFLRAISPGGVPVLLVGLPIAPSPLRFYG